MSGGNYLLHGAIIVFGCLGIFVFMNVYVFDFPEPSILLIGLVNWGLVLSALIGMIICLIKYNDANCTKSEGDKQ